MVRNLVGALIQVGEEKTEAQDITNMLNKETNSTHYVTVPACGLYLVDIKY